MRRFSEFLAERAPVTRSQKIVMLFASHDTQNAMRAYCKKHGFDITTKYSGDKISDDQFDFHLTLIASSNPVFMPLSQHLIRPVTLKPIGFQELGKDRRVPTLKFAVSPILMTKRQFLIDTYGMIPTFPEFKPHMSLSYNWDGKPSLSSVPLPTFPIVLDQWVAKEFEP